MQSCTQPDRGADKKRGHIHLKGKDIEIFTNIHGDEFSTKSQIFIFWIIGIKHINSSMFYKRPVHTPINHRSEEHTSELQSRGHLVCRLLLEKKKIKNKEI